MSGKTGIHLRVSLRNTKPIRLMKTFKSTLAYCRPFPATSRYSEIDTKSQDGHQQVQSIAQKSVLQRQAARSVWWKCPAHSTSPGKWVWAHGPNTPCALSSGPLLHVEQASLRHKAVVRGILDPCPFEWVLPIQQRTCQSSWHQTQWKS